MSLKRAHGSGSPGRPHVADVRTTSWTVYLRPGIYTYRSDKRATMRGTFTVRPDRPLV
jgi:hypothetical protein